MSAYDQRAADAPVIRSEVERVWRDENDRLRAELAETRTALAAQIDAKAAFVIAGNAVATAAEDMAHVSSLVGEPWRALRHAAEAWRSVRGDAPAPTEPLDEGSDPGAHFNHDPDVCGCEPPAVELPVTLSSVDDVAAVCSSLDMSQVRERTWYCNPQVTVWAAGTCDEGTGGVEIDSVPLHLDVQFPAATSLVVAAIEAARGGSR